MVNCNHFYVVLLSVMCVVAHGSHRSVVLDEIQSLRQRARFDRQEGQLVINYKKDPPQRSSDHVLSSHGAMQVRPLTEEGAGAPCHMNGLVVRREMGNLGVSSFQEVVSLLITDALGSTWNYYDDWPSMADIIQKDRWVTKDEADDFRKKCKRKVTFFPTGQVDLDETPFNITDGSWVAKIRSQVCGSESPAKGRPVMNANGRMELGDCTVVLIQGHWEHAGFFHRYRSFIQSNIIRSRESMMKQYTPQYIKTQKPIADLVVYLRLGDKSNAGDTELTFLSGYYSEVLKRTRKKAKTCWLVTQTPRDERAKELSRQYDCMLYSSASAYADWTIMLAAPHILVMAASTYVYFQSLIGSATEVHYPAVGFFHSRHNVCMKKANSHSHFGQIRLPFNDPRVVYHDIYSRRFFLTYDEFMHQQRALPCASIIDQHVCAASNKFLFGAESRYCYRVANATTLTRAAAAQKEAFDSAGKALQKLKYPFA